MKVHLTTLGCPKNQVDSELMLGMLARAVDEGAGVDDHALGILGALREREPGPGQHAEHQLRVDLVLRAPEGGEVDLHDGHISISTERRKQRLRRT